MDATALTFCYKTTFFQRAVAGCREQWVWGGQEREDVLDTFLFGRQEKISSLSLKSVGKLWDVTPDTCTGMEFHFTQIGNNHPAWFNHTCKTLMQGVQATLKLFRALWEQHFFVGHFWQKKYIQLKLLVNNNNKKLKIKKHLIILFCFFYSKVVKQPPFFPVQ